MIRRALLASPLAAWLFVPPALQGQDPWPGTGRDRGQGVVSHALEAFSPAAWPAVDTMLIHEAPTASSPVVARFLFLVPEPYTWSYRLEAVEDDIESRALEFDYEILGLPVDSFVPDEPWVRVLYGRGPDAAGRYGWVRTGDGVAGSSRWEEILSERSLFFLGPADEIRFYDAPGGNPVDIDLAPGLVALPPTFDYRMEPLEVAGSWLQVRIVTPDDACVAERIETREQVAWIKYLDDRGRPRVWYYTRGC